MMIQHGQPLSQVHRVAFVEPVQPLIAVRRLPIMCPLLVAFWAACCDKAVIPALYGVDVTRSWNRTGFAISFAWVWTGQRILLRLLNLWIDSMVNKTSGRETA
jgi:hypothetical protein